MQVTYYQCSLIIFPTSAVNCVWGEWEIGECSTTCGLGVRENTRIKLVEEAKGGLCNDKYTETEECYLQDCPGNNKKR